jgi:hypothetical protein
MIAHPRYKPLWPVKTIARGPAMFALLHSSLKWNGASYPLKYESSSAVIFPERRTHGHTYDIVQIVVRKPIIVAQPIGHSVPFSNVVHTAWLSLVLG